jgi:HK97 family phage major capsid protein
MAAAAADPDARDRLARHRREMRDVAALAPETRDITTATLNGLIPPAYIVDAFAAAVRGQRVVADIISAPLPPGGMTVIVPAVTTPATAGSQTAQNTNPTPTDPATTDRSAAIVTIMAPALISRQGFERGAFDVLVTGELGGVLAQQVEAQVINGTGASGQMQGILGTSGVQTVTYTSASPTSAELSSRTAALLSACSASGLPDVLVMHPRRYLYFSSRTEAGFDQALQIPQPGDPAGTVARLHGVPVVTSATMPTNLGTGTNEDRIIAMHRRDFVLYEDAVTIDVINATNPALLRVGLRQYAALVARTPSAAGVMSGTGLLATPS